MGDTELKLPALEIRQGDRKLYQFAVEGKRLADISTVSRISRDDEDEIRGYQRPEVQRHVKAIRTYLESPGALMPNALVIAFDSRGERLGGITRSRGREIERRRGILGDAIAKKLTHGPRGRGVPRHERVYP